MVNRYSIYTNDIVKFMYKYKNLYPVKVLRGSYCSSDLNYVIRDYYNMTNMQWKKFIIELKRDKLIHIQKIYRQNYGSYNIYWTDNRKLLQEYDVEVVDSKDTNIQNRLISRSLANELMNYADGRDDDDKHLYQIAVETVYKANVNNKFDRHFTINSSGKMTYTPANRQTAINEDREKWLSDSKYRSEIKFGKGLRKIFSNQEINIPDKIIEHFANRLKGKYQFQGQIKIVKGEDIKHWYYGQNYASYNTETLGNSCMRHSSCQDYFDIYTENDDKVEMIIAIDDETKLIGRAILWKTDTHGLFCDRIYGNQTTINAIKDYAKKLGAYTKYEQSYSNAKLVSSTGELIDQTIEITLNKGGFDYYPYMDTLKYSDDIQDPDKLILNSYSGDFELESTDGGPRANLITLHNGDNVHEDDATYIERYDEYYHEDDCVYSEYHGEYIIYYESISINDGDDYAWEDSDDFVYVSQEDRHFHKDDVVYSDYEGEYLYNYVECVIHGFISRCHSQLIEVNNNQYTCHNDVTIDDLLENKIITQAEYETYEE